MRQSFKNYLKSKRSIIGQNNDGFYVVFGQDIDFSEIYAEIDGENKLWEEIKGQSHKVLAALDMGLYFVRQPSEIENLSYYENRTAERQEESILKRAHSFNFALGRLKKHIDYVNKINLQKNEK